jgi:hypothetical protein
MLSAETLALIAAVAAHLVAIARLFNVLKPLYGWLPAKAQPVVIALGAGLPPLAETLLGATSKEQVILAVASGLTAFFMAVKGAPPPSSGDAQPVAAQPHVFLQNEDGSPIEFRALPALATCLVLLSMAGCSSAAAIKPPCDKSRMRAIDAAYIAEVGSTCLAKYSRAADCPEYRRIKAKHRAALRKECPK